MEAELDRPGRGLGRSECGQRVAHPDDRLRAARRVRLAGEEEQERVASELQQCPALGVGDLEQAFEAMWRRYCERAA